MVEQFVPWTPVQAQVPLRSLTAAAKRLSGQSKRAGLGVSSKKRMEEEDWQTDAWTAYDLVGEFQFLVDTLSRRTGQAHLYVGKQDVEGERPERLSDTDPVNDLMDMFGGTHSGRSQILERLTTNMQVVGEGWLAGIPPVGEDGERGDAGVTPIRDLDWHMLSISEIKMTQDTEVELSLDTDEKVTYSPDDIFLIRVWNPHPRWSWKARSSSRASVPILKELINLTMHVSAQVDSRLAGAGLLVVPQSAQDALARSAGLTEDELDVAPDQFTDALIEAMIQPIQDRDSASSVVPLVVTAPDDATGRFQHISFASPLDTEARNLREEAVTRLARGMDAPPEVLLGTASMNHWGGWLVKQETVSSHVEPILALICDALTTQYLWPALEEQGMDPEEAQAYVVWYDVDHLVSRPNLAEEAKALHAEGVISDEALRRASGFDDSDTPDGVADSPAADIVLNMVRENPSLLTTPGTAALLETVEALLKGKGTDPVDTSALRPDTDDDEDQNQDQDDDDPNTGDGAAPSGPTSGAPVG